MGQAAAKDSTEHRWPLFRDLYKTLLTISSGTVVASVTFMQGSHLEQDKQFFVLGFVSLIVSVISQLVIPLANVIQQGFYAEKNTETEYLRNERATKWGNTSSFLLLLSICTTILGIILIGSFVVQNI